MKGDFDLRSVPRKFRFPFPLAWVGSVENLPILEQVTERESKLELCIRLSGDEGAACETIDGETYTLGYPNVLVKLPGSSHVFHFQHARNALYFKYDNQLEHAFRNMGLLTEPHAWTFRSTPEINAMLLEAYELMQRTRQYGVADKLDLLALRLFEALLVQRDEQQETIGSQDATIRKIASWLHFNFSQQVNFNQLAKDNALSPRNFYRCWKKIFPLPPATYLLEIRLEKATRLLLETGLSIRQIAHELGYQDTAFFCELFRRRHQLTPLQYRKRHLHVMTRQ